MMEKECPLCKQANHCVARDETVVCWCAVYHFSERMNDYLSSLENKDACICEQCIKKMVNKFNS